MWRDCVIVETELTSETRCRRRRARHDSGPGLGVDTPSATIERLQLFAASGTMIMSTNKRK
jgi:hypothetical protein